MTLTRAKFNELTADLVERTMTPVRKALADADLKASDLAKVLMVGGSTRIPAVYDAVKKELGCEPFKGINPMSALLSALPSRAAFCRATSRVCCCSTLPR